MSWSGRCGHAVLADWFAVSWSGRCGHAVLADWFAVSWSGRCGHAVLADWFAVSWSGRCGHAVLADWVAVSCSGRCGHAVLADWFAVSWSGRCGRFRAMLADRPVPVYTSPRSAVFGTSVTYVRHCIVFADFVAPFQCHPEEITIINLRDVSGRKPQGSHRKL